MSWRPSDDGDHEIETRFFARPVDSSCLVDGCVRDVGHSLAGWPHAWRHLAPAHDESWRPHDPWRRPRVFTYHPNQVEITIDGLRWRGVGA